MSWHEIFPYLTEEQVRPKERVSRLYRASDDLRLPVSLEWATREQYASAFYRRARENGFFYLNEFAAQLEGRYETDRGFFAGFLDRNGVLYGYYYEDEDAVFACIRPDGTTDAVARSGEELRERMERLDAETLAARAAPCPLRAAIAKKPQL